MKIRIHTHTYNSGKAQSLNKVARATDQLMFIVDAVNSIDRLSSEISKKEDKIIYKKKTSTIKHPTRG